MTKLPGPVPNLDEERFTYRLIEKRKNWFTLVDYPEAHFCYADEREVSLTAPPVPPHHQDSAPGNCKLWYIIEKPGPNKV